MSRHRWAVLWLVVVAGLLSVPTVHSDVGAVGTRRHDPSSETSAEGPRAKLAQTAPRLSIRSWLGGHRNEPRTNVRFLTLASITLAIATLLTLETRRPQRRRVPRFLATGRAIPSRAPPGTVPA